jgi:hypothetical protein
MALASWTQQQILDQLISGSRWSGPTITYLISNELQPPKLNATGAAHRRLLRHHTPSSVVRWGQNRPRVPHQVGLADVHC